MLKCRWCRETQHSSFFAHLDWTWLSCDKCRSVSVCVSVILLCVHWPFLHKLFWLITYSAATVYYLFCCLVTLPICMYLNYLVPLHMDSILIPVYIAILIILTHWVFILLFLLFLCIVWKGLWVSLSLLVCCLQSVTNNILFYFVATLLEKKVPSMT